MPYATNDGIRIYYEREGSGPPVLLHTGWCGTLHDWRDFGYVGALKDRYELILMDPRGHGASDAPHAVAAYAPALRVADVTAVLDHAAISKAVFWGYSMGAVVGYSMAYYAPERCRALILGGSSPYSSTPGGAQFMVDSLRQNQASNFTNPAFPPGWLARLSTCDIAALESAMLALDTRPSYAEAIGRFPSPVLLYAGDRDDSCARMRRAVEEMPQLRSVTLPGLNHVEGVVQGECILPYAKAFLAELA